MGIVTGQGLIGLIRERYGVRWTALALLALRRRQPRHALRPVRGHRRRARPRRRPARHRACPVAALAVSVLVLRGSFRRVEHVLLALSSVFVAYVDRRVPRPSRLARRRARPRRPDAARHARRRARGRRDDRDDARALGPGVHPVVRRRQAPAPARPARSSASTSSLGAVLTGVIGVFVVIACAATLHAQGVSIDDARDAARRARAARGARRRRRCSASACSAPGCSPRRCCRCRRRTRSPTPPAPRPSSTTAARRARCSTARSPRSSSSRSLVVCVPGAPLIPILFLSQALNAVLLLPLIVFMRALGRDRRRDGRATSLGPRRLARDRWRRSCLIAAEHPR